VLGTHFAVDHPTELQLGAGYRVRPNARYFGLGPGALEANESRYTHEMSWVGAAVERRLHRSISLELVSLFTTVGARGPKDDDDPTLVEVFGDDRPLGYGDRSDGVTVGLTLQSDTTERTGTPESGALIRGGGSYFVETGEGDLSYWTTRGEIQLFVPLWFTERALALRAFYTWIDPTAGRGTASIPFQRLMTNDDPDLLRGYRDFRWRDRGMTLATAEYRWPIWAGRGNGDFGLHMYLFTDIGQVFGDNEEIALRNMTESFGAGVRVVSWGWFAGRAEIGFSEEETVLRLRADQTFQFQKGGLYHGRNPVPSR
jgi:outer membrane protein assembly factor BamA